LYQTFLHSSGGHFGFSNHLKSRLKNDHPMIIYVLFSGFWEEIKKNIFHIVLCLVVVVTMDFRSKTWFFLLKTVIHIRNSLISHTIQLNLTNPVFSLQKITIHDYRGNSYYFLWKNDKNFHDFVYTIFIQVKKWSGCTRVQWV